MSREELILGFAGLVEFAAALVIVWHVLKGCLEIVRRHGAFQARLVVAEGVLSALGFVIAATLLKTICLRDWNQVGMFAFIVVFRTLLKRVFDWEKRLLLS